MVAMNNDVLEARAKLAINKNISMPCGKGCSVVCCDPIITGFFVPRNLLLKKDKSEVISLIKENIQDTLNLKTTDNNDCFIFEGIYLSEIETDYGFVSDKKIEEIILQKTGKNISRKKLDEYVFKVKEKFSTINVGVTAIFSCPNYDKKEYACTIHETRPSLCREYMCEQLNPEKIDFSTKELIKRINLQKEQRKIVIDNSTKDFNTAIRLYLDKLGN